MGEINLSFDDLLQAIIQKKGGGKRFVEEAPDLDELVRTIVSKFEDLQHLREHLDRLRCFRVDGGPIPSWTTRVVRGHEAFIKLSGIDVALEVYATLFDKKSDVEKEALIYHELLHLHVTETGELKILRHHDIEEFIPVVAKFGPVLPEHRLFVLALKPHAELVQKIWEEDDSGDVEERSS